MSEQEVILEDKKLKKKLWQQIIDAAKKALEKNDNTKKGIIKKTAELLEQSGMPLEMICGTITRELNGFASKNYITECLDSKYKNMNQSHSTPRPKPKVEDEDKIGNVTLPNDDKNLMEQSSISTITTDNQTGIPVVNEIKDTEIEEIEIEKSMLPETVDEESQHDVLSPNGQQGQEQEQISIEESAKVSKTNEFDIIRPEDYVIENLHTYSSQFKDRIIIYLDQEVRRLKHI